MSMLQQKLKGFSSSEQQHALVMAVLCLRNSLQASAMTLKNRGWIGLCSLFLASHLLLHSLLGRAALVDMNRSVELFRQGGVPQAGNKSTAGIASLRIALLSTYPPQACGIAEFTRDLYAKGLLISDLVMSSGVELGIIVVDEGTLARSSYGPEVAAIVRKEEAADYVLAAQLLNAEFDVVSLQHEFGIFGGEQGELILLLLDRLTIPVVTNFHTVLPDPAVQPKVIFNKIAHLSNLVTVMLPLCDHIAANYTSDVRCRFMPHGVPLKAQGKPPDLERHRIAKNKRIILSPGLLSPNKGIESMLEAMVTLKSSVPDALYVVVGRQHPGVKGIDYVGGIREQVHKLGLHSSVVFVTAYQTKEQLIGWISQADIVVTPYNDPTQISSGTLSMTIGLGRVAVSTAFPYADWICRAENEMAKTTSRACLTVPFTGNISAGLAAALERILLNQGLQKSMQKAAFMHGERAQWPRVAEEWVAMLRSEAMKGRAATRSEPILKVWTEDLAREVVLRTRRGVAAAAILPKLGLGPLRFAGIVTASAATCQADVGKSSFYATNGMSVLHGQILKGDYLFLHTLPQRGLQFGKGVRYGGMFITYQVQDKQAELRLLPDAWSVICSGRNIVLSMRTFLTDPADKSIKVGEITVEFTLHGDFSLLTWKVTVKAFGICLENVEVQSALDSMSSLYPNHRFNRFYSKLRELELLQAKNAVTEVDIYSHDRDGPLSWNLFTDQTGEFGLVTVIRNETALRYVTTHNPTKGNFHYVVHRYHSSSICPSEPFSVCEDKIVLRNLDVGHIKSISQVVDSIETLIGIDVSGPANRALVAQAFEALELYESHPLTW